MTLLTTGFAGRFYGGLLYEHPSWERHAEYFPSPMEAHATFAYRIGTPDGKRIPPRLIKWDSVGEPHLQYPEVTLPWGWPATDEHAWLELVSLPGTTLLLIEAHAFPTKKLIVQHGRITTEGAPS